MKFTKKPLVATLAELTDEMFNKYESGSGNLKIGLRHEVKTHECGLEDHETMQFNSVSHVVKTASEMQAIPGFKCVEIFTYNFDQRTQRWSNRLLYRWTADASDVSFYTPEAG